MPTLSKLSFVDANECAQIPFAGKLTCTGKYEEPERDCPDVHEQRAQQWRSALRVVIHIEPKRCEYVLGPLITVIAERVRLNTWWPAKELSESDPITLMLGEKPSIEFYLSPILLRQSFIMREFVDALSKAAIEAALAAKDPEAIAERAAAV